MNCIDPVRVRKLLEDAQYNLNEAEKCADRYGPFETGLLRGEVRAYQKVLGEGPSATREAREGNHIKGRN